MTFRAKFPMPEGNAALVPSVLAADFTCLKNSLSPVRENADWVQVDVMDGVFVPNISFGPGIVPAVAAAACLPVDAHLMVAEPGRFISSFAAAGAGLITVHAEAKGVAACIRKIKGLGLRAGLAVRPRTPIGKVIPFLKSVDLILVMTVEPGFGGQPFLPAMLAKVEKARALITGSGRKIWLQVDGGINQRTARLASVAGADSFVIGSALFACEKPAEFLRGLRAKL